MRARDTLAKELLGLFGPGEWETGLVVLIEVLQKERPERARRAVDLVGEALIAKDAEETLK